MTIKKMLKKLTPVPLLEGYRRIQRQREKDRNATRTTEEVFTEIYAANKWAPGSNSFDSGVGSTDQRIMAAYVGAVQNWLSRISSAKLTIVDLGCGDFRIGRQLVDFCARYIGIDIVKPLIDYNEQHFGSPNVEFLHLNMIEDPLPEADVCFLRQVLQHLSNDQIQTVLRRVEKYRWTVITEHHPSNANLTRANVDKPHGADIRLFDRSGVFLDQPPFNVSRQRLNLLLELEGHAFSGWHDPGVIRTYVLTP
ncbi:MAG: class I SAM-dependent methyltransferase [Verrucomicrobiota bacterium]